MKVIVESPKEVIVDGVNCGKVADAIANMPQLAPAIQLALEKCWEDRLESITNSLVSPLD